MRALMAGHQAAGNREALEEIALQLGRRREAGPAVFGVILESLASSVGADYNDLALECLRTCVSPDAPLRYLRKHGNSEDTYAKVKAAVVPRRSEDLQLSTLKDIRARIDKGKSAR
jgi:hypothetical protein